MLEIKNLNILLNQKYLIKDLSLNLNTNDKLAIIGEEGNGKSTLLKVIVGLCDYANWSGVINTNNKKIGYLKQFFEEKDLELTVYDYLFENNDYYDKLKQFYIYIKQLNINEEILNEKNCNLSGGEKVKISILKLLLEENDILLLDEPTNDLDIQTLIWLENFIINCKKPIIYISHDETLLSKTANMILHLEQLKKKTECNYTLLKLNYDDYLKTRIEKITKQNQIAKFEKKEYSKQMLKLTQIKQKVDYQLNTISRSDPHGAQLLKKKMRSIKSQEKRIDSRDLTNKIECEESINLFFEEVSIPNKKEILKINISSLVINNKILSSNIILEIYGAKKVVIIGTNGIGKTTLLKNIYEKLKSRDDITVGYMPQSYNDVFKDYIYPLDYLCPNGDKFTISKIRSFLGNLNITSEEMISKIENLSGGTKTKIFLLKLIIDKCNVLVLDEPTRNLSPLSNPIIRNILTYFGGTIISVSHDRKYIDEVIDNIYEMTTFGLKKIK